MVSAFSWTSDLKVGGSKPGPCHRVVSSGKKLYFMLPFSTQVNKWYQRYTAWGNPVMDYRVQNKIRAFSLNLTVFFLKADF